MTSGRSVTAQPPDFRQGFGLLSLSMLLPKATSSTESWSHYLFVDEAYLSSFKQRVYTLAIEETGMTDIEQFIKMTVSWMDPPNSEFAAKVLMHDLDISLVTPEGRVLYGNNKGSIDASRDELNNVEQVILRPSDIHSVGLYLLQVQSKLLTHSERQK